jgi:hypothetical protein
VAAAARFSALCWHRAASSIPSSSIGFSPENSFFFNWLLCGDGIVLLSEVSGANRQAGPSFSFAASFLSQWKTMLFDGCLRFEMDGN